MNHISIGFFAFLSLVLTPLMADSDAFISLGERLFKETRFSRYFWLHSLQDINTQLDHGETHLENLIVLDTVVPSPFQGQTTSCASCHLVDQAFGEDGPGMRVYNDFSAQAPVPSAKDGKTHTARNTPTLVGIGSPFLRNRFSHYDAEFNDHAGTVMGNMLGRNMGWAVDESIFAKNHLLRVLKEDDGSTDLSQEFGGSYERILRGTHPAIEEDFRLQEQERLDLKKASDQQILDYVTKAVTAYMNSLDFEADEQGQYNGSAFDKFLLKNGFTTVPREGESIQNYNKRLRAFLEKIEKPQYIEPIYLEAHKKSFGFQEKELEGARVFFSLPNRLNQDGRCFQCHQAPLYSDQSFHNIGSSQLSYDATHFRGAFSQLDLPKNNEQRAGQFFQAKPTIDDPKKVDLGVWNFYQRSEQLTEFIKKDICSNEQIPCQKLGLEQMVARFKTPTLRNLGLSAPYLHTGEKNNLRQLLMHYMQVSVLARRDQLRNPSPFLKEIMINGQGVYVLESFLESLNENYE